MAANDDVTNQASRLGYLELKKRVKPTVTLYPNWPFRAIARLAEPFVARLPVSANQITWSGVAAAAIGGIVLVAAPRDGVWIAIFLFCLFEISGCLDGQIARRREQFSPFGSWSGLISERYGYMIIGIAFSWHAFLSTDSPVVLFLALVGIILREAIGSLGSLTLAKMPPGWRETMYSEEFVYGGSKLFQFLLKCVFYTGSMYSFLVFLGILFPIELEVAAFMTVYGLATYLAMTWKVGSAAYRESFNSAKDR